MNRQERVLRLCSLVQREDVTLIERRASDIYGWHIIHVEGRNDWTWGVDMGNPSMNKCLLILRDTHTGKLVIDKYFVRPKNESSWVPMPQAFCDLFEVVVFPHV